MNAHECTECGGQLTAKDSGWIINHRVDDLTGRQERYFAVWCDECREEKRREPGITYY